MSQALGGRRPLGRDDSQDGAERHAASDPNFDPDWNTNSIFNPGVDDTCPPRVHTPGTGYRLDDARATCVATTGWSCSSRATRRTPRCGIRKSTFIRATARPCTKTPSRVLHGRHRRHRRRKPGVSHGPTDHGVTDLVNQDPDAYWYNPTVRITKRPASHPAPRSPPILLARVPAASTAPPLARSTRARGLARSRSSIRTSWRRLQTTAT